MRTTFLAVMGYTVISVVSAESQALRPVVSHGDVVSEANGATLKEVIGWVRCGDNGYGVLGTLQGESAGVTTDNDRVALHYLDGQLRVVYREGSPAPGLPSGVFLDGLESHDSILNFRFGASEPSSDRLLFAAPASWTGSDPLNYHTFWEYTSNGLSLITTSNQPWPFSSAYRTGGLGDFTRFADAPEAIGFTTSRFSTSGGHWFGDTARFYLDGVGDTPEVWTTSLLTTVDGLEFNPYPPTRPRPNAALPKVLHGIYRTGQPGVTSDNGSAIFLLTPSGKYQEVVRKGEPASGYADMSFHAFETAKTHLSSDGSVVLFWARVSDGSSFESGVWRLDSDGIELVIGSDMPSQLIGGNPISGLLIDPGSLTHDGMIFDITYFEGDACDFLIEAVHVDFDGMVEQLPIYGIPVPGAGDVVPGYCRQPRYSARTDSDDVLLSFNYFDTNEDRWIQRLAYLDRSRSSVLPVISEALPFDFSQQQDGSEINVATDVEYPKLLRDGVVAFSARAVGADVGGIYEFELMPAQCLADVNNDGQLTPTDFTAWINAFNNNLPECDQNGDGACTPTDFTAWIANFSAGCP